jgi:deoxyadenosine/deoxycytidine kinase
MRIVIDGPIGSGKTTILRMLQEIGYNVRFEQINQWPLEQFYKDPRRWAFTLQMAILKTMEIPEDGTIHERCIQTSNHVFWEMLSDTFSPIENEIYQYFYEKHVWIPDIHIYLDATPEKCFENIQKRIQTGDSFVTMEYMVKLDQAYKKFTEKHPIIKIDANLCISEVFKNVCQVIGCQQPLS